MAMITETFARSHVRCPRLKMGLKMATVRENFPRNLEAIMGIRKLRQADLARALEVTNGTVAQWLKGKILPELGRLDAIASVLGVHRNDLIDDPKAPAYYFDPPTAKRDQQGRIPAESVFVAVKSLAKILGYSLVKDKS
jgi:transcriptional regulator with XRE-family HTH domain